MKNWVINTIIGVLLIGVSCLLGWWSTIGTDDTNDIISKISVNVVSILLPLLVLHTTLMIQLLNEIRRYNELHTNAKIIDVIKSIRRNFIAEIIIILLAIIILVANTYCKTIDVQEYTGCCKYIILNSQIITNSYVIFSVLYFMWVIIDEVGGILELYIENNKTAEK